MSRRAGRGAFGLSGRAGAYQGFVAVLAIFGATQAHAYDPGYPYNQYTPVGSKSSECYEDLPGSLFTTGRIQFSCRVTALAHINGSDAPKEEFVGVACGRGDTDQMARHNAWSRAMSTVKDLELARQKAKQEAGLIDQSDYYVSDGMVDHCVHVASTAQRETVQREGSPAIMAPLSASPRVASTPPAEEPDGGDEPAAQPDPNTATFIIHNNSPYRVGVEFYSQDRNRAWPGGNRQYTVNNDGTYDLTCNAGEKICYGAWRDGNSSVYWGTGMNDAHGCERCCVTCGHSFETTLVDNAGSDDGGGGGDASLGDFIGAATAIMNGATAIIGSGGGGGGGGGTVRVPSRPIPGGRSPQSGSTITGHSR